MAVVPDGAPQGVTTTDITPVRKRQDGGDHKAAEVNEKEPDIDVALDRVDSDYDEAAKIYVPRDDEEYIDPRLKDYPIPLVAKTVDLHNDFRYGWVMSRFACVVF